MRHEEPQEGVLGAELEAERIAEVSVALQVAAQHDVSPGQGWATCSSMGVLTLA